MSCRNRRVAYGRRTEVAAQLKLVEGTIIFLREGRLDGYQKIISVHETETEKTHANRASNLYAYTYRTDKQKKFLHCLKWEKLLFTQIAPTPHPPPSKI